MRKPKLDLSPLGEHEDEFREAVLGLADVKSIERELRGWLKELDDEDPSLVIFQMEELFKELSYLADRASRLCEIARGALGKGK